MDPTQQQHRQQQVQVKSETTTTSSSGAAYLLHQLQVGGTTGYTVGVPPSQQQQHPQQQLGVPAQQQFQLISSSPTPTQLTNFIFPGSNMTMTQTIQSATQAENVPRMQQLTQQQQFNERERQIKRRTKTGCMTCRKRRIKVSPHNPKRVNGSVTKENRSVTIVKSHIENARATKLTPTQTAVPSDPNQIHPPASLHPQHIPATILPPPPTSQAPTPTRPSPPSINAVDLEQHFQAGRHDSHHTTSIHGHLSNTRWQKNSIP